RRAPAYSHYNQRALAPEESLSGIFPQPLSSVTGEAAFFPALTSNGVKESTGRLMNASQGVGASAPTSRTLRERALAPEETLPSPPNPLMRQLLALAGVFFARLENPPLLNGYCGGCLPARFSLRADTRSPRWQLHWDAAGRGSATAPGAASDEIRGRRLPRLARQPGPGRVRD